MQTAVASIPQPGLPSAVPAPAETGANAAASVDFAALLLGQLVGDVAKGILPAADTTEALETPTTPPADGVSDPTLLLAAMGLVLEPRPVLNTTAAAAPALTPAANAPAMTLAITPSPSPLPGDAASLPATATPNLPATSATPGALLTAAAQAPANFAGVEPKLAESVEAIAEPLPQGVAMHAPQHTTSRSAGDTLQVATPVKDPAWPAEFTQKIVWMATQDKQNAQITLNPPQMGPIEISLSVKNDQASALFVSANAEVREVIESALPRLREMLAGVGVELGQTNVSSESFRQAQDNAGGERRTGTGAERMGGSPVVQEIGEGAARSELRTGNGLVDTFA
ncbi:MAG: flagellar hook-length control protein FliK [Rhodocyclales bacterium]|nr:flagellar hook-length control protein FliK [Rhodocyclales bacterium]